MGAKGERTGEAPAQEDRRDYLELWINLSRHDWGSLVVIPADRDGSTAHLANTLAGIGQRLSYGSVTAITVATLEYGSALALADLQQHVKRERRLGSRTVRAVEVKPEPSEASGVNPKSEPPSSAEPPPPGPAAQSTQSTNGERAGAKGAGVGEALVVVPPARVIISVPPVVTEPLALTATEHADAVVLAVRVNRSRLGELKRSIELVGRERIMGCVLVR